LRGDDGGDGSGNPAELAEEQVHLAVEQRVLGVLPNFYSTYDWNAPPLDAPRKFELALHSVSDPVAFLGAGFVAGVEQANGSYRGYGGGMAGMASDLAQPMRMMLWAEC